MSCDDRLRARDGQRARVYRAGAWVPALTWWDDIDALAQQLQAWAAQPWWRVRWPDVTAVQVSSKRGRWSYGCATHRTIRLSRETLWTDRLVTHELAHVLTGPPAAGHGPEFVTAWHRLLVHAHGAAEAHLMLAAGCRTFGVHTSAELTLPAVLAQAVDAGTGLAGVHAAAVAYVHTRPRPGG